MLYLKLNVKFIDNFSHHYDMPSSNRSLQFFVQRIFSDRLICNETLKF